MMKTPILLLLSLVCIPAIAQRYHDAALFNAPNGKVKYIEYNTGRICFDEDGKIDFKQSTYLTLYDKFEISYDEQGYPVTLTTNIDEQTIKYDEKHRISSRQFKGESKYMVVYQYFKNEVLMRQQFIENGKINTVTTRYYQNSFDDRANWTSKRGKTEGNSSINTTSTNFSFNPWVSGSFGNASSTKVDYDNEDRVIAYWTDNHFVKTDSPNELSLTDENDLLPFFLPDLKKYTPSEIKKSLREKGIEFKDEKYYLKAKNSDKLLYGVPVAYMESIKDGSRAVRNFLFRMDFSNKEQRGDFVVFLIEELKKLDIQLANRDVKYGINYGLNSAFTYSIKYEDFDEDKNPIYGVSIHRHIRYILTPGAFFNRLPATDWKRD